VRSLEDALSEQDELRLVEHLSGCESCQTELEQLAAKKSEWTRVGTTLREESSGPENRPVATELREDHHVADLPHEDTLADFAVDFLAPALNEEALGRLDGIDILEVIGRGGMGVVLKGFEEELNRPVVVKMLAPHLASSGAARKRFAREAQAAAVIVHPNVMPILTVNSSGRLPYLVMPYMACESLQQRIDREGPLETLDVLRIAHQVACGLAAAHAQGLVHRDVKPANILLERGVDRVLLTDFGLARAADDASLTRTGVIAGTPQFMSPEQARGEAVDARSDLFCLGSVMYVLCAGRPPFRAETSYGVLRRVTDEEPRSLRELNATIPDWLAGIVKRLHSKDPAQRFQSAEEVAELLEQCLAHVQQPDAVSLPEPAQTAAKSIRHPNPKRQRGDRSGPERSGAKPRSRFGLGLLIAVVAAAFMLLLNPDLFNTSPDSNTRSAARGGSERSQTPSTRPFSPVGEGAQRADEGASQTTTKSQTSSSDSWHDDVAPGIVELRAETADLEQRAGRLWDNRRIRATPLNFGEKP
jgi:serine/threonine-protein kinase